MIHTNKHLAYILRTSPEVLDNIVNNIDEYYFETEKPKMKYGEFQVENGQIRFRKINPSIYPLKKIQQNIDVLIKKIELPDYAYGSVNGRNNILNALSHINNKFFLTIDLKDYFSNISHNKIFSTLVAEHFSPAVARILTKLTTYKGRLPQGTPSSPSIANLAFKETGDKLIAFLNQYGIKFTSFLDDLTFSSRYDFKSIVQRIISIIKSGGFPVSFNKIHYKSKMPEVTGLIIHNGKLLLPPKVKKRSKTNPNIAEYARQVKIANDNLKLVYHPS